MASHKVESCKSHCLCRVLVCHCELEDKMSIEFVLFVVGFMTEMVVMWLVLGFKEN